MPSGKTHDRLTYMAALPAGLACHGVFGTWEAAVALAGGVLFGGLMFGPDLDVKSVQYHRWGPLRWIWWPYQRMFSHRSTWTHGLVWGLLLRLLYLGALTIALGAIAFALIHTYVTPLAWRIDPRAALVSLDHPASRHVYFVLAGAWLGGALHTGADLAVSAWKRGFRRRSRRR